MASNVPKVRLVVGLFGAADELSAALAELGRKRLQPRQIRIVAPMRALDGALDGWPSNGAARGFGAWVVCEPTGGPFSWSFTLADAPDGVPANPIVVEDVRALMALHEHQWSLRRQSTQLDRLLRTGGALLLVEPDTDEEERSACTALLRYASGGIQTHEITRLSHGGAA